MPRTCTVCAHPERAAIEAALVAGTPYRHIASQHCVSYKAVERHKDAHIPAAIAQAQEARQAAQALCRRINARRQQDWYAWTLGGHLYARMAGQHVPAEPLVYEVRSRGGWLAVLAIDRRERDEMRRLTARPTSGVWWWRLPEAYRFGDYQRAS